MADLYRIFSDEGLAGLLPYATNPNSHGYQILVDKIRAGIPLSFIRTQMEAPHLVVKNGTYQALFYTTPEKAQEQADSLLAQGYKPTLRICQTATAGREHFSGCSTTAPPTFCWMTPFRCPSTTWPMMFPIMMGSQPRSICSAIGP